MLSLGTFIYAVKYVTKCLWGEFLCGQACGANNFQMLKWFEHVYSYDHGEV